MRIIYLISAISVLLSSSAAASQPLEPSLPSSIVVSREIRCDNLHISIRYQETRREPHTVNDDLSRATNVTLQLLRINGRNITRDGLVSARQVFSSFAWIDNIRTTCYEGDVIISPSGTPLHDWIAYVDDDQQAPPTEVTRSIRIGIDGGVRVSG